MTFETVAKTSQIRPIEEQIVALLHQRDKRAVELIYTHYGGTLLGVIARILKSEGLAEDIFQDAIVKIWKNAANYDANKGRLFTWMINICRNLAIDVLRSTKFQTTLKIQHADQLVGSETAPSYTFNPDNIGVKESVEKLKPEHIAIIEAIYYKGYTQKETAEALELPLGTVKTRLRIAIRELRQLLGLGHT